MTDAAVELRKGALDVLILQALSWGPAHGYGISRWIRETTDGVLNVEEGALYPALHRMELKGWINPTWGLSDNARRAKYYRMTAEGRRRLRSEASSWTRFAAAMAKVLERTNPPEWARQS